MVVVPAGAFTMGSPASEQGRNDDEGPQHVVTIGKAFAVGKLHVTVEQFDAFVRETRYEASSKCWTFEGGKWEERAGRSWRNPGFTQGRTHPLVCVSWNDAKAYVDWTAKKTGKPYRLLTEAEWEYAARGQTSPGTYPRFWFGNDAKAFCQNGNGADQKAQDSIEGAKAGRSFRAMTDMPTRRRPGITRRMHSVCTTWPATRGNGRRIAGMATTTARPMTVWPGQLEIVTFV
jgi:formylglycine-generating enzyme required for sulfatase activity